MSLTKELSRDKTDWVKWPQLETHWQAQHYETPHRASKKSDNSRPHFWWWDSHVSPKSSKWLQENLSEMDSKVSAMLKIIEEGADSSSQSAEMFRKQRPELVSLVEGFYGTYRALVERHNFLTKELRQNIAPALQAHFAGASIHEPPADALLKHGSDGFDISSLSSYSIPGALEYDDDSHSEFSVKSSKGQVDEEEGSPWVPRPSFDERGFEFQPFALGSEEEQAWPQRLNRNSGVSENVTELMKMVRVLEEEKKVLKAKLDEDVEKLKDLQSQVSSLISKTKGDQEQENGELNERSADQTTNMALKVEGLSRELEATRSGMQELVEQRECLQTSMRLEDRLSLLETENLERCQLVVTLRADMKELENAKNNAITKCQLSEEECRALKVSEEGVKALLEAKLAEGFSLINHKQALEDELARVRRLMGEENQRLAERLSQALKKDVDGERAAMEAKDELNKELLELSALAETLKQSLLARDMEILKLQEDLMKSADCQSESEQRLGDEISHLQTEEMRWRSEVTTNSALMAEKVATLRRENAALHEDLSVKLELLLKLQKDVESLTEERSSLSEALQAMAAEMQEYKNDLEFFKEEVIPSLEERVVELQGEVTDLLMCNERHVAEIDSLRKQVADANSERLLLHDENEKLKVELMFSFEMLKHVDGVLSIVNTENSKLGDKLGLLEHCCQKQEQNLVRVSDENEDLTRGFLTITEERNVLKAEVQRMMAMFGEVEKLQGELRAARQDDMSVKVTEALDVDTVVSGDLGRLAKDGRTEELQASPSHGLLVGMLKEDILYLQQEIHRLQNKEVEARDFTAAAPDDTPSPRKNATSSFSSSILSVEDMHAMLDDLQRLKEENFNLAEEIESLKSLSLKARMENSVLQARVASVQEENEHICSEVSSYKAGVARLEGECHSWKVKNEHLGLEVSSCKEHMESLGGECLLLQKKNAELEGDLKSSAGERSKLEETRHMLEGVITALERNNRCLQAETEFGSMEMEKLRSTTSSMHVNATELIDRMKTKMMLVLEEVKLMIEECREDLGDEGIVQIMKGIELPFVSPSADKQHKIIQRIDQRDGQEDMTELRAQNVFLLTELQARAEETSILLQFVVFIRKMLISILGGEHTCHGDALRSPTDANFGKVEGHFAEETTSAFVEHHSILAERLHQAFADEKLEHELQDLKEGRKRLKEELEMRSAEVQKMEIELEKLQLLLEQRERGKGHERAEGEEGRKRLRAEESAKELREMLAQQRRQIGRMQEELMFGEEHQKAAAENQVTVLVSMESASSMEGWDEEHVNLLRRELESLRGLNRRYFAELQTISQDLQSMGSIIKSAQDQLLLGAPQGGGEMESMADLRTLNSNTLIDLRTQDNRVSIDSAQLLLSPFSPRITGEEDSLAAHQSSNASAIGRFPLKPRNFGFTWFLLLFSPDRKATGTLAGNKSNKSWVGRKPARSSESAAIMVERGRRKTAGCWACVSNTGRIDSFDQR